MQQPLKGGSATVPRDRATRRAQSWDSNMEKWNWARRPSRKQWPMHARVVTIGTAVVLAFSCGALPAVAQNGAIAIESGRI